jgi:N-sulfoglucosamine sulfohydrolase
MATSMKYTHILLAACLLPSCLTSAAERPNILWITCEDISPYLGSYHCPEAHTPNLDRLAGEGIRFTRAYANAPVCAVARSTLLTGMYASTTGTHHMRSRPQLPASIPAYPKILREAGYYCTNNVKTDYNSSFETIKKTLWNETSGRAHWKNRKPGQPFFAVFNITTTHESQLAAGSIRNHVKAGLIPAKPRIDPKDIELPPYHPDLPEIRNDWARLHDLITRMDEQVGGKLRELEEAGVADNTIVFYYSDHGGMLARSKRYIYNVGTQVPLIVRFPEKWRHLAPAEPGQTSERLVSFVDFPKTALSLTGVEIPCLMQGRVFLGEDTEAAPKTVHFFRDRMSERPDFSRAVTDGRYYFIRNFMPHRPPGRDTRYGNTMQANWNAWENHFDQGNGDPVQSQFYQSKPLIELFDTEADPWHVTNLAADPAQRGRIDALSRDLDAWMVETRDTGLIPEPLVPDLAGPGHFHKTLYEYAQSDAYPVAELLEIAKQAAQGDPEKTDQYLACTSHAHPVARHHGAYALFLTHNDDAAVQDALRKMIAGDPMPANRIMAAQALGRCGDPDTAYQSLRKEIDATGNGYVFLYALNALQYAHVDERLTKDDWQSFKNKTFDRKQDPFGAELAQRIIDDALALFPKRRAVD